MDFSFTKEEEAFRQQVRKALKANPPDKFPVQVKDDGFGYGAWSNEYARFMGEQGWISMTWPKQYGGRERPQMEQLIMMEELAYARAPACAAFGAISMAQTLIELGSDILKKDLLPGMAAGEIKFWLAMSEPGAGSDLLSLKTSAVEEDDCYVVNGQKVWSSMAHEANYGFLFAKTDNTVPPHKGLSMFILDKRLPGVTLRPLINMAGRHYHNEVFLDNVRIPKAYLVGKKNQGFFQMLKGLEGDRFWARWVKPPYCQGILDELVQYCKETKRDGIRLADDPAIRNSLAESAIEIEACRLLFYRMAGMIQKGVALTYESAMPKVMADEMGQRLFNKGMQILGPYSQLGEDTKWAPLRGFIQYMYLACPGQTFGGGTSEVIRNTAARALGLPQ